eukprot:1838314-Rhodomonas_salina.2
MRSRRSANRVWVVGPPDLDIWAEEGGQNLVFFVVERVDRLSKHELPRFLHLGQRVLDRFAEQRQVVAKNELLSRSIKIFALVSGARGFEVCC